MSPCAAAALALCTAGAAWLSQGTLAFTAAGGPRIALLPLSPIPLLLSAVAGAVVLAAWRAGGSLAPLWLLLLVVLAWLPRMLPAAFLIWSGPILLLVWTGIGLSLAASTPATEGIEARIRDLAGRRLSKRPWLAAALAAALVYGVAAWSVSPSIPEGDEPHYLIITQSLLLDGDIRIANNHRRGDYRAYFAGDLPKPDFRRHGRNGEIYSIHAPGLPALIAPAFAIGGYRGVVIFLILVTAAGAGLAWYLAWLVTGRADAAWFGWAAVTLSTSAVFHSFTVYPDGAGGVLALTGVWALVRAGRDAGTGDERIGPWFIHGAALALLPWLHTRFALIAGGLGALILLRLGTNRNAAGKAVAFLLLPAVSAICWLGFFIAIYGTPDPSAPYANEEGSMAFIPGGLAGLLFDQRFGLLAYAPVLAFALWGLFRMAATRLHRRLGFELLFILVPYLLAVTHFAMWWGGTSAPARFAVPMLPMLAIPAAVSWETMCSRSARATAVAALGGTVFATAALVFVGGGRMAYNVRQGYANWLEWLSPAAELARGLPVWWRGSEALLYRDILVWAAAFAVAAAALRAIEGARAVRSRGALAAATMALYAVAVMAAVTVCWRLAGVHGATETAAQLGALRRIGAEPRLLALELPAIRRLRADDVPRALRIEPDRSTTLGGAGQNDRPLYQIPLLPAGRYRLEPRGMHASGWLMVGIGREQFSLTSGPLDGPVPPVDLDFPVDVRAIVVRGDEQARRSIEGLTVTALSILPPDARLTSEVAQRAVRYGETTAFFLDDRSFAEPEAFWVGGARTSAVVLQPAQPRSAIALLVRNGPVQNGVTLASGAWKVEAVMAAGEERRLEVPLQPGRSAALLTIQASGGFRPSEVSPGSLDNRFLGLWVKPLD